MKQILLNEITEYNGIINTVYSKLEFSSFRNNAELYWIKKGAQTLKEQIERLLKIENWTNIEKTFLNKVNELIITKLEKNNLITLTIDELKELSGLSIEAMIDRDEIVQIEIINKKFDFNMDNLKKILFILDANVRLLKLIKKKLISDEIEDKDIKNIKNISLALIKSYLFLLNSGILDNQITETMSETKRIWREYHPISSLAYHNDLYN